LINGVGERPNAPNSPAAALNVAETLTSPTNDRADLAEAVKDSAAFVVLMDVAVVVVFWVMMSGLFSKSGRSDASSFAR
jgi:hypothetical protein